MALDKETQELFEDVRVKLGIRIRKVELTDDTMCRLLKYAVGDYAQYVQRSATLTALMWLQEKLLKLKIVYALIIITLNIMNLLL